MLHSIEKLPPRVESAYVPAARTWMVVIVLMVVTLLGRAVGLMALPLFGDEGIYLRWTQIIRQDWLANAFVSLVDPKPPLHFWLMALVWNPSRDPLLAARMVSIFSGVLLVPVVMLLCRQLVAMGEARNEVDANAGMAGGMAEGGAGRAAGLITALLVICCPYLAFYQRLALADSLLVLEAVTVFWLSLRFARAAWEPLPISLNLGFWRQSVPLGGAIGLSMLTRQIIPYEFWAFPVAAFIVHGVGRKKATAWDTLPQARATWGQAANRFCSWFILALLLGTLLWSPFLIAQPVRYHEEGEPTRPLTHESFQAELRRRVLYQPQFSESKTLRQRVAQVRENLQRLAVPTQGDGAERHLVLWGSRGVHASGDLTTGWYWVYLTPVVFLGSLLAFFYLAWGGRWRWVLLLGFWEFLMVGPLVLVADVAYSRYALGGVVPLLVALGLALTDIMGRILSAERRTDRGGNSARAWWRWGLAGGLLVLMLAWPAWEIHLQNRHWRTQTLVAADRYQYITGWTGGQATMAAVRSLMVTAPGRPIVVITSNAWGNPADAVQLYLRLRPNTQVYYVDWLGREPILRPLGAGVGGEDTYRLRADKWLYLPERAVVLPEDMPVYYITADPVYTPDPVPALELLGKKDHLVAGPWYFKNPRDILDKEPQDQVVVVRLR